MNDDMVAQVLKAYGPLGLVVVGALTAMRFLYGQLSLAQAQLGVSQEKRIADAQAAMGKLLELVDRRHADTALLVKAIDASGDANQQQRALLQASLDATNDARRELHVLVESLAERAPPAQLQRPTTTTRRGV